MVINLGWGIGLGMILNGELFRGHNGFAGEFSHLPLFSNNKLCSCGQKRLSGDGSSLLGSGRQGVVSPGPDHKESHPQGELSFGSSGFSVVRVQNRYNANDRSVLTSATAQGSYTCRID